MNLHSRLSAWGDSLARMLGERTDFGIRYTSPTLQQQEEYLKVHGLESLLPYRSYDSRTQLFHNENSFGFVIETHPMVGCTEEMQREISGLFQHTLQEGANLQFILYADPRIGDLLDDWQHPRQVMGGIYQDVARRRSEHFRKLIGDGESDVIPRNFRCIISYSEEGQCQDPVQEMRLSQTRDQVKAALQTLGVPLKVMDAEDLIRFLDGMINFSLDSEPSLKKWHPYDAINTQIPGSECGWQVEAGKLVLNEGEYAIRSYSIAREPDYWSLHAMGELIGDPFRDLLRVKVPFLLHYGVSVANQDRTRTRLQTPQAWVERQAYSPIAKNIPVIKAQHKELTFVRGQLARGERFVQGSMTILLFAPADRLVKEEHVLKSLFRSKRWDVRADKYIHLQQYLSCLPMMWGEGMPADLGYHRRLKTTLSSESANLLPIQAEWKGTSPTGIPLVGRRGQLFFWEPFATRDGNFNVSVVGRSGSGKSVFMQELVMNALGTRAQVFIIDVGRSFEKLVKLLGGSYMEFTAEANLCLNPFTTIPAGDEKETEDALSMLHAVVALMAAPRDGTTDLENSYIERGIKQAWHKKGREATISDIALALNAMKEPLAVKLATSLFPYTAEGSYGRYFNGPANIDLSSPMVVVELEELKERKDLQAVVLQLIILQITNRLYMGDRKTRTYLVLDEAWDLLRARQAGEFIETAARRFRKYSGSLVVGTQSVHDFYISPGAQAAFDNSDWLCMLAQKRESVEQLKKMERISLDPVMEEALNSLRTRSGEYAEVMIKGPHGYAIGRLSLDPFSGLLYSTKAEEFAAVQDYVKAGIPLVEALEQLSQGRAA